MSDLFRSKTIYSSEHWTSSVRVSLSKAAGVVECSWLLLLGACVSLVTCRRCAGSLPGLWSSWLRACDYAEPLWQPQRGKSLRPGVWRLKMKERRHRDETFYCTFKKKKKSERNWSIIHSFHPSSTTASPPLCVTEVVRVEKAALQSGQSTNSSQGCIETNNNTHSHLPPVCSCCVACLGMRRKLHIGRPELNLWPSCCAKPALWM